MKSKQRIKEARTAWIFITPYLIGYLIFHFTPVLISLVLSFTNIRYISKLDALKFIGLSNYVEMFGDPDFLGAVGNSFAFTLIYVPLVMLIGLLLAVLINQNIYQRNLIRSMIFMPYVSNMVAIAVVWSLILDPISGPVNAFLKSIGLKTLPMWMMSSDSALITVVLIAIWHDVGFQFITFLAALQGVPMELKEAAAIDGASPWKIFLHVTIPSIMPTIFLMTITSITTSLKNFTIIQVLTEGGPGSSTVVLPLNIVQTAFSSMRMGYACAQSIMMLILIMAITVFQWNMQKKYQD